jgi:E3 ubiquitin-protein ligase RNF14
VFEKYLDYKSSNFEIDLSKEIKFICPNVKCSETYIIWKEADFVNCTKCKKKYCTSCKFEFHEGFTCKEFVEAGGKLVLDDYELIKLMQDKSWKNCPTCKCIVEKTGGCNFITCASPIC